MVSDLSCCSFARFIILGDGQNFTNVSPEICARESSGVHLLAVVIPLDGHHAFGIGEYFHGGVMESANTSKKVNKAKFCQLHGLSVPYDGLARDVFVECESSSQNKA